MVLVCPVPVGLQMALSGFGLRRLIPESICRGVSIADDLAAKIDGKVELCAGSHVRALCERAHPGSSLVCALIVEV